MSRLVSVLLVLFGAYLVFFNGLYPSDPCTSSCPGQMFPFPVITQPDPTVVGTLSIALGVVALVVGILGLVRSSSVVVGMALSVVGIYLLLMRYLYPPNPCRTACAAIPGYAVIAWLSLAVGIVAIIVGMVGFVSGSHAEP